MHSLLILPTFSFLVFSVPTCPRRLDAESLVKRFGHVDQGLVDRPVVYTEGLSRLGALEDVDGRVDLGPGRLVTLGDVLPVREGLAEGLEDQLQSLRPGSHTMPSTVQGRLTTT